MLTISQLASYAGVTVRTVRHYHAVGLLTEPARDYSGYRRYDAQAVVELIRIRTLAEAGVPLSRVRELLDAGPEEFAAAVDEVDERLRAEIRERRRHRARVSQLAAGDSLALPQEVVAYLARCRELGVNERVIEIERDSWILIAAQAPDQVPGLMEMKHQQIEDPKVRELLVELGEYIECAPDDPRLVELADRMEAFLYAAGDAASEAAPAEEFSLSPELIALLDSAFIDSFPAARRLLDLLEERGWTGWTMIERKDR
jgi:DNA-binding transcriptional MerR regulator